MKVSKNLAKQIKKEDHKSFRINLSVERKLLVVLAEGILVSNQGFTEGGTLHVMVCMAAQVKWLAVFASACHEKCAKFDSFGSETGHDRHMRSMVLNIGNSDILLTSMVTLVLSAPCNECSLEPTPKRRRVPASFRSRFRRGRLK